MMDTPAGIPDWVTVPVCPLDPAASRPSMNTDKSGPDPVESSPEEAVSESWLIETRASALRCPKEPLDPSGSDGNVSPLLSSAFSTSSPSVPGSCPHSR